MLIGIIISALHDGASSSYLLFGSNSSTTVITISMPCITIYSSRIGNMRPDVSL